MKRTGRVMVPPFELDEEQAIRDAQNGDPDGFEWLIRRHIGAVFGFLLRWLGERQLAEEVFQDAAVRGSRSIHRLKPGHPFRPWFFRIAVNRGKTHLKNRARMEEAPLEERHYPTRPDAARVEARHTLEHGLARLSPSDRQLLLLRYGQELSMAEVAEIVDAPLVVVQMRVSRARKRFREVVRAIEEEA